MPDNIYNENKKIVKKLVVKEKVLWRTIVWFAVALRDRRRATRLETSSVHQAVLGLLGAGRLSGMFFLAALTIRRETSLAQSDIEEEEKELEEGRWDEMRYEQRIQTS